MSDEVKKPEAGEWWQGPICRFRFVGMDSKGWYAMEMQNGCIASFPAKAIGEWHHLPDCTGWDWKPETFPQWYVCGNSVGWHTTVFVVRDTATTYFCVESDGTEKRSEDFIWSQSFVSSGLWRQITKEQAEAMLDKPKPIEADPEEWVEFDSSLVDFPRYEIDELRHHCDVTFEPAIFAWGEKTNAWPRQRHNYRIRCRRKHLPKIEPKAKRVPVRLYWYDGNIVGRYDHSQPTDESFHEIKSDGNGGWYVESSL